MVLVFLKPIVHSDCTASSSSSFSYSGRLCEVPNNILITFVIFIFIFIFVAMKYLLAKMIVATERLVEVGSTTCVGMMVLFAFFRRKTHGY